MYHPKYQGTLGEQGMARFGERLGGLTRPILGLQDLSHGLCVGVWNTAEGWLFDDDDRGLYDRRMRALFDHLGIPTDEIPYRDYDARKRLKPLVLDTQSWIMLYEFVELCPKLFAMAGNRSDNSREENARRVGLLATSLERNLSVVLEREGSPYRFLHGELAPITNEAEIAEIERAAATKDRFVVARAHIEEAIRHFTKRPNAAFADSIKQSVSALESILEITTGIAPGDIQAQLREFQSRYGLHKALALMIDKLYGYASAEDGVRHGAGDPVKVGDSEARFTLVTCSALFNFLVTRVAASPG